MDAIKLSESPLAIRLVWEWATVDGEEKPNTYFDVLNSQLTHDKEHDVHALGDSHPAARRHSAREASSLVRTLESGRQPRIMIELVWDGMTSAQRL